MRQSKPNAAWPAPGTSAPPTPLPAGRAGRRRRRNGGLSQAQVQQLADLSKNYAQTLVMLPPYWTWFRHRARLHWTTIRFTPTGGTNLPRRAGVYVFHVKPGIAGNLEVSYLMYIGETTSLHQRYRDYVREARGPNEARSRLVRMFQQYPDHLYFSYTVVARGRRRVLEDKLMTAFWPPVNRNLPAGIRAARAAWT